MRKTRRARPALSETTTTFPPAPLPSLCHLLRRTDHPDSCLPAIGAATEVSGASCLPPLAQAQAQGGCPGAPRTGAPSAVSVAFNLRSNPDEGLREARPPAPAVPHAGLVPVGPWKPVFRAGTRVCVLGRNEREMLQFPRMPRGRESGPRCGVAIGVPLGFHHLQP